MGTPGKVKDALDTPSVRIMVVGFLFSPSYDRVVLIRKTHPAWQAGKFNGLGGHVKEGESPREAMAREFEEESGLAIAPGAWQEYARMEGIDSEGDRWKLHVFCATSSRCETVDSKTQEHVSVLPVTAASTKEALSNLSWLIPLGIDALQSPFPCEVRAKIKGDL